jgi:hypothetical protein
MAAKDNDHTRFHVGNGHRTAQPANIRGGDFTVTTPRATLKARDVVV